jgi:uroporphyrin-III C-methyltransferase
LLVFAVIYIVKVKNDISDANQSLVAEFASQNEKTGQRIIELGQEVEQLRDHLDVLSESFSELYENQPGNNEDWALAEVEYLLVIATHRLLLEQDVSTALSAMEAAALRLESMGNVDLIPVREQITSDINRLRAVNIVDITGLSIYLADLIDRIGDMPVKKPDLQTPAAENDQPQQSISEEHRLNWNDVLAKIWQELKSLVVIKKTGEVKNVFLMPDQEYFLYQNLRLELENARMSVLRRNTENLRTSVKLITGWLQTYFDTSDSSVVNMLDSLNRMFTLELDPDLPDISSSLETLRAYMRQRETAQHHTENVMMPVS